jgi:hypothetical protein
VFAFGKVLLHTLAYAPILPPIKAENDNDQHHAQRNQSDLQFTHFLFRRITIR